jgi:hypothetical protein
MKNVRTFADLTATLNKRASAIKSGAETNGQPAGQQKNAAGEDVVPEKDPTDEGTTAIPKDPDGATKKTVGLENKTNAEVTSSFTVPPSKTVEGEEKPATELAKKAQGVAAGIKKLADTLNKKSGVGSDGKSVTPNMPPNDKVNEGTTPGGKLQPPTGGTTKGVNPDANAKTSADKTAASGEAAGAADGPQTEKKVTLPAGDSKGEIPASKTNTDTTTKEKGAAVDPFLKLAANILAAGKQGEDWLIKSVGPEAAAQIKAAAEEKCKGCGMVKTACKCQPAGDKDKMASEDDLKIDSSFHVKLATILLSTEEGRKIAQAQIEKAHGAEAAADIVKAASIMEERAMQLAALEESGALAAEEKWASATPEEQQRIVKLARVHARTRDGYQSDLEKIAYDAGAMAAAQMGDAGMLGGAGAGAGPDAGAGAAPGGAPGGAGGGDPAAALAAMGAGGGGGAGGGMPPEAGGGMPPGGGGGMPGAGGEGLSEEAVVQALDQMVQSGELTPELAAEILQAITGGGAPGGAGGAPGGAPGEGGGMPPGAEAGGGGMPPGAGGEGGEPAAKPAKEEKAEKKPEKKDDGEDDKEATVIKRAHELATAVIKAPVAAAK